jgi:hypothetical protein
MSKHQIQQGDVCIEIIDTIPQKAKRIDDMVLKHGEVTGHKHELVGDVQIFELDGVKYFAVGSDGATLTHQEHQPITFAPKTIARLAAGVFEYDYETEEAKRVID